MIQVQNNPYIFPHKPAIKSSNALQYSSCTSTLIHDTVCFSGKIPATAKKIKPEYIKPEQVQVMADLLVTKLINLHKANHLTVYTIKKVFKQVIPNIKVVFKDIPNALKEILEGDTLVMPHKGSRKTEIRLNIDLLKSNKPIEVLNGLMTVAHEGTHAGRYNTEEGYKFFTYLNDPANRSFVKKLNIIYLTANKYTLENTDLFRKWTRSNNPDVFNNVIDELFKEFKITEKEEKIKILEKLHPVILMENEAYQSQYKIYSALTSTPSFNFTFFDGFAECIARRLEQEGGSRSNLPIKNYNSSVCPNR